MADQFQFSQDSLTAFSVLKRRMWVKIRDLAKHRAAEHQRSIINEDDMRACASEAVEALRLEIESENAV